MNREKFFSTIDLGKFECPTTFLSGSNWQASVKERVNSADSVEVFYDSQIADSEIVKEVIRITNSNCVEAIPVSGPVTEAIESFCQLKPKVPRLVISIGGGSTTDFAKAAIALRLFGKLHNLGNGLEAGTQVRNQERPFFICFPTTTGSGAEASKYFVTYSNRTGSKVHGKSWDLVADLVIHDPRVTHGLPDTVAVLTAFDAFVHFFESYLPVGESTIFSKLLSSFGMREVLSAVSELFDTSLRPFAVNRLHVLGTLGGVAISNTRTGHIHEAAGALLEHSNLTHAETLWVFFPSFAADILFRAGPLGGGQSLNKVIEQPELGLNSLDELIAFWSESFECAGLQRGWITARNLRYEVNQVIDATVSRVCSDQTWVQKESPVVLNAQIVRGLVERALKDFRDCNV